MKGDRIRKEVREHIERIQLEEHCNRQKAVQEASRRYTDWARYGAWYEDKRYWNARLAVLSTLENREPSLCPTKPHMKMPSSRFS